MFGLVKLLGFVVLTVLGLVVATAYEPGTYTSVSHVAGYPVVEMAQEGARGWIAVGQVDARGVLVGAQVGVGLVSIVQAGGGVFFCLGQAAVSFVLIGQVGIGLSLFLGQLGVGVQAWGQVAYKSRKHLKALSSEFSHLLSFRPDNTRFSRMQTSSVEADPATPSFAQPGGWPQALLGALTNRGLNVSIPLAAGILRIEPWRLVFEGVGVEPLIIDEPSAAVLQLSRSQRPGKFSALRLLLGRDPWEHWGHVELRCGNQRIRVSAPMPASALAGLPIMEQHASTCSTEALLDLLSTAKTLELAVPTGDSDGTLVTSTIPKKALLFEALKAVMRGPILALHVAPFLVLPKLVLLGFGVLAGDWLTVAYVCLVVVFFALLALALLLYAWVGPAEEFAAVAEESGPLRIGDSKSTQATTTQRAADLPNVCQDCGRAHEAHFKFCLGCGGVCSPASSRTHL